MSDDQLQMLQRELMDVQQQKTNPLSDRTVAEILIKLHQKGFKFYSTTDNNEYITPTQIDTQIIRIVQERGRLSLGILPQLLNLNQDLIQSRINGICGKSTHVRHNLWLISKDYIQNLLLSLKQKLQMSGIVQLDQEALRYEFDIKFMEKIVKDHINQFDVDIRDHKMITRQYFRMKKKKVLGFLLAMTRPIEVSTITKAIQSMDEEKNTSTVEIQNIIEELVADKKLKGRYQNLYYIPDRFTLNQKSVIIKFLENNGYLSFDMLQKNYMVPKPEEWIKKNLDAEDYLIFEGICFKKSLLTSYQSQIQSLLKGEGFVEISNVIPFDLQQKKMNKFLTQHCQLKKFIVNEGICYSNEWIEKCINQFRDKVIFEIFFNDDKAKKEAKGKKKGPKKEKKKETLTEGEIVETLFDAGLAQYSIAEGMAESLLPVLLVKLDELKVKLQKQLTQSQGVINSGFLKYKKCKSILRNQENLIRTIKTLDKQKKKSGPWIDTQFGPTQSDPTGQYSLIYYDGIVPKDWPPIQNLKWKNVEHHQIFKTKPFKSKFLPKSLLFDILEILDYHNKISKNKINTPLTDMEFEEAPYVFKFYVSANDHRFVLVDNKFPYFVMPDTEEGEGQHIEFASTGLYGIIEKAYSKFRFCYKSLLSVPFHQLFTQLTGLSKIDRLELTGTIKSGEYTEEVIKKICEMGWDNDKLVIFMAEGKQKKKADIVGINEDEWIYCLKPYLVVKKEENLLLLPEQIQIKVQQNLFNVFTNVWIIGNQ